MKRLIFVFVFVLVLVFTILVGCTPASTTGTEPVTQPTTADTSVTTTTVPTTTELSTTTTIFTSTTMPTTMLPTTTQTTTTIATTTATTTAKPTTTQQLTAKPTTVSTKPPITITELPLSVYRGETAQISITGAPNTVYRIYVSYKSGPSEAGGLGSKTSDATGKVGWSWKVGSNTTPGVWPIIISDGTTQIERKIEVLKK